MPPRAGVDSGCCSSHAQACGGHTEVYMDVLRQRDGNGVLRLGSASKGVLVKKVHVLLSIYLPPALHTEGPKDVPTCYPLLFPV